MSGLPANGYQRTAEGRGQPLQPEGVLEEIRQSLRDLQFGSLLVIVQDGVVVQMDRTEKKRLPRQ